MAEHRLFRRQLFNGIRIAPSGVRKTGGDNAHSFDGHAGRRLRSGLHYTEHGAAHVIPILVNEAGDGIAGHQQGLDSPLLHKSKHIAGHVQNLLSRVVPIGHIFPISEVE